MLNTFGNDELKEEHVDAFELAYTATFGGRTTLGLAVYQNDTDDNINFTYLLPNAENPQGLPGLEFYSVANPARGVGAQSGARDHAEPRADGRAGAAAGARSGRSACPTRWRRT